MPTVVDAIANTAGGSGSLTILGGDGRVVDSVTWSAVHDRARRMAAVLAAAGVGRGGRVALLGDTSVDLVTALQGVWLAGAAVTVLPPPSPGGRPEDASSLTGIATDAGFDLMLADAPLAAAATGLATGARVLPLPVLRDRADSAAAPTLPYRPVPADLAVLQYTSGSTRIPRGVPVTHGHLAANIAAIRAATGHDALHPARMLSWLPLYHDMGLVGFLTLPMSCGCGLFLQSPAAFARRPFGWLEAVSRYRITVSAGPNFAFALMTRVLTGDVALDLSCLRFLLTGGEPVIAATMAAFTDTAGRYGLDPAVVVPAYGLAESTLAVTVSRPGAGLRTDSVDAHLLESQGQAVPPALGSQARHLVILGEPVPDTSLRIVIGGTGEPVGTRRVGHIEIRGPSVVGPANGWLRTGDLGYLTEAGELVVCGRAKDVLFAAGRNIFPQDVELAAAEVPGVRLGRVAAFGVPGEHGDRLVVALEVRGVDPVTVRREVAAAVRTEVGLSPHMVLTLLPGGLPRTSSGKLRRAETRRRYLSGQLGTAQAEQSDDHPPASTNRPAHQGLRSGRALPATEVTR